MWFAALLSTQTTWKADVVGPFTFLPKPLPFHLWHFLKYSDSFHLVRKPFISERESTRDLNAFQNFIRKTWKMPSLSGAFPVHLSWFCWCSLWSAVVHVTFQNNVPIFSVLIRLLLSVVGTNLNQNTEKFVGSSVLILLLKYKWRGEPLWSILCQNRKALLSWPARLDNMQLFVISCLVNWQTLNYFLYAVFDSLSNLLGKTLFATQLYFIF